MSVNSLIPNLIQVNSFFDCNYSSLIVSVFGRGVVITFKNKLIYGNIDDLSINYLAKVELGCYIASIEAFKGERNMNIVTEYIGIPECGGRYRTTATIKFGKETLKFCGEGETRKMAAFNCHVYMNTLKHPFDELYERVLQEIVKHTPNYT